MVRLQDNTAIIKENTANKLSARLGFPFAFLGLFIGLLLSLILVLLLLLFKTAN